MYIIISTTNPSEIGVVCSSYRTRVPPCGWRDFTHGWLYHDMYTDGAVYPMVNIQKTMEKSTMLYSWVNQLFRLGHFQQLFVCLPEGNPHDHGINSPG